MSHFHIKLTKLILLLLEILNKQGIFFIKFQFFNIILR